MSERPPLDLLRDARHHAIQAQDMITQMTTEKSASAPLHDFALRYCLAIIGAATKMLPDELKLQHPDIPWRAIWALRNRLVHAYWLIDPDTTLRIARDDVPVLLVALDRMICDVEDVVS